MSLLSDEDRKAIEAAIERAEAGTSGEIVFATAEASANYQHATLQGPLSEWPSPRPSSFCFLSRIPQPPALDGSNFVCCFLYRSPRLSWRRWIISKQEMDARVKEAAFLQFYASGLYRTRESNGIEIYLSVFEREVVVIGDRAIHEKMGDKHWQDVRDLIIQGIQNGDARGGICAAIESCGKALAHYFPPRADDVNELSNRVIRRSLRPDAP
jgi:putative membrane protein